MEPSPAWQAEPLINQKWKWLQKIFVNITRNLIRSFSNSFLNSKILPTTALEIWKVSCEDLLPVPSCRVVSVNYRVYLPASKYTGFANINMIDANGVYLMVEKFASTISVARTT